MNRDPAPHHPLVQRLIDARQITDALFSIVKPEYLYERPIRERHRIVFYIGHLEAFDRNLLDQRLCALPAFNASLDHLFAFGIDPVDGDLPTDVPSDWPSLEVVRGYGQQARAQIDRELAALNIDGQPQAEGARVGAAEQLLHVAIEHRLMHAETLAYMLHQLPLAQKIGPSHGDAEGHASGAASRHGLRASEPDHTQMVLVPAGPALLGMPRDSGCFGWDNEFGELRVDVPAFEIDRYMVTNGAYLEFVNAGGYQQRTWWKDRDWDWKESERITHPTGWSQRDGDGNGTWMLRTMFEEIPLPLDWPVYVSHAEASAYARWAGKALPTEAQWQRAAHGAPHAASGNFDFRSWDPQAVDAHPDNISAFGVEGQFGNGWEWTSTLFDALPGFEPFPFYLGYSANFFDGQHYVLKGGSARTAQCMLRPAFRNWFQAHYQYVYAGFRCVRG
ncbi:ergothioneine biosynthesis protein EgtB [Paraburkholderia phenazinium]|uniref:Ergothioneine biosynthesis protein EgtB n=2 Tax=Paraburkholderia phenazinium TaxID=60549 RepID=A0A1G8MMR0_9BURK|nr:SUMF1/EgtB/PvdO family nonheme iron enzyme [Paraburkholderia phenazinium]SDI69167.1 ergothioneine biosynthesis protein EgtB [Paraburkholderia phenazinium]